MADFAPITCQFCGEGDFDLPGIKLHLLSGWCDAFNAIEDVKPARRWTGIGHLEATGYIPDGSSAERDKRNALSWQMENHS